jgi:hypothetical protein
VPQTLGLLIQFQQQHLRPLVIRWFAEATESLLPALPLQGSVDGTRCHNCLQCSHGLGSSSMHHLSRCSLCCVSTAGSVSCSHSERVLLSLRSVSRCMFCSAISRLLNLRWEHTVSSSTSPSCHHASALVLADRASFLDVGHLMREIHCGHHLSACVIRAVMANA